MVCLVGHFGVEVVHVVHVSVDSWVEANGFVGSEVGGPIIWSIDVRGEIRGAATVLGALVDVAEGELLLRWRIHSC